ncbi:GAF domain-containing protein [Chitinivorax sp. PXF-14]|uniref:GAF domain-containing protein n=1 Tax=Chitinivorax sp. PXF-14 TaxID=3230488 RepID=UPI00346711B4
MGVGIDAIPHRLTSYLRLSGLGSLADMPGFTDAVIESAARLDARPASAPQPADAAAIYRYRVPLLSDDGSCSVFDALAPNPYDLSAALGGVQPQTTRRLLQIGALLDETLADIPCDWLGVYQLCERPVGPALVKLAYRGKPSRAEFPLTPEFAAHSNNSAVGLSGQARVIDHVASYVERGGAYYICDPAVQAEACLPVFDLDGRVIGIIDAEDAQPAHFQGAKLALLVALCLALTSWLPVQAQP